MKKEKLYVVKIGGNVINNDKILKRLLGEFTSISGHKILVHGGGRLLDELAAKLGLSQQMVNGRRITDEETLKLAAMVYAGILGKTIVAGLQAAGANAIGLSGADMNVVKAVKRKQAELDFGFVGDIPADGVNAEALSLLLENGLIPVMCSITHDGNGQLFNTNADTMSSAIAKAMAERYEVHLIYCFEKKGVLMNAEDETSLIPNMTPATYQQLLEQKIVSQGMIPKLDNAFAALRDGVSSVVIGHAEELLNTIQQKENAGTYLIA